MVHFLLREETSCGSVEGRSQRPKVPPPEIPALMTCYSWPERVSARKAPPAGGDPASVSAYPPPSASAGAADLVTTLMSLPVRARTFSSNANGG